MTAFISFVYFENMKVNRMISKQNVINGIMQNTLSFIYQHLLIYIRIREKSKKFLWQKIVNVMIYLLLFIFTPPKHSMFE